MIKANWDVFKTKFSENPEKNFEWFCYLLFCREHNLQKGIFRYKNQSAIETNLIHVDDDIVGWQAKFYTVSLSLKNKEILETIQNAKRDYSDITKLIFYINQEWGQTKGKEPKGKIDAEAEALKLGIAIEWRMTSFFESPFVSIENKIISSYFLNESSLIDLSPKRGWYPYDNWAYAPLGVKEEYIVSDKTVIYNDKNEEKPLLEGLNELRGKLLKAKSAIRLVGLSGVGKTRFVQAIFDERIGENTPESSLVCYTDMSREPDPSPIFMVEQLLEIGERVILVVDNCPPDLHRELVKSVGKEISNISLLTVEYDVRDDLPDETDVFKLEPNSPEVIEKIIEKRFEHISQIDARNIAEFSGGNARIALALANTMKKDETLSGLKDEELFKRLFEQRNSPNENLLKSAEVLSLVYSFNGKDFNQDSELEFLASLIGRTGLELYRDVEELKRRDLIQVRGEWRAVLPQAISNRLAKKSLEVIPKEYITAKFLESDSERIIKSFAHRISFLHDSKNAVEIVKDWLTKDGWLGKSNCNFNEFGMYVFLNIAPVAPESVLNCIERAAEDRSTDFLDPVKNNKSIDFVNLLRHIAYEPELFDRTVKIICSFVVFEKKGSKNNTIEEHLKSLFWMNLSGTKASLEQRASIINELLKSDDTTEQTIGFSLLQAALNTGYFTSSYSFDFGARSRDYGWHPSTTKEVIHWYETYLKICANLALSKNDFSEQARRFLADNFRGLWNSSLCFDLLIKVAKELHDTKPWIEGWLAVKESIGFHYDSYSPEIKEKINKLEAYLKPNSLYEKAKVFILSGHHSLLDNDLEASHEDRERSQVLLNQECFNVGKELAKNKKILDSLISEIVLSDNYMISELMKGLATEYYDKKELWTLHYEQYKILPKSNWQFSAITSLLSYWSENDLEYFNELMDRLLNDDYFGEYFPWLQAVHIDSDALKRLHQSLEINKAPIWQYKNLAYGRNHEKITDDDLADLMKHLLLKDGGIDTAIEILSMRFHGQIKEKHSLLLIKIGYELLSVYDYKGNDSSGNVDYKLEIILNTCINNLLDETYAISICKSLAKGIKTFRISNYHKFIQVLSKTYPTIYLNILFNDDVINNYNKSQYNFFSDFEGKKSIVDNIPEVNLIQWCDQNHMLRYPFIASIIYPLEIYENNTVVKPIVYGLIENTLVLEEVLNSFANSIEPKSWSGSWADVIEKRLTLFTELQSHENEIVQKWAELEYQKYIDLIKRTRISEQEKDENRYERFE